jgi:alpha-L-arabinofuranosidase
VSNHYTITSDPDIQVIGSGSIFDGHDIPSPGAGDYHSYTKPDTWIAEFGKFDNVTTPHIIGEMASTFPNGGTGWDSGVLMPFPWYISRFSYELVCSLGLLLM